MFILIFVPELFFVVCIYVSLYRTCALVFAGFSRLESCEIDVLHVVVFNA